MQRHKKLRPLLKYFVDKQGKTYMPQIYRYGGTKMSSTETYVMK